MGAARIGVARSDPDGTLAVPVETIHLTKSSAAKAAKSKKSGRGEAPQVVQDPVARIAAIAQEFEVIEVVLGNPVSLQGIKGKAAEFAQDFASKLASAIPELPVILLDERLSTVQAQQDLHSVGISTRQGRSVIDQAAAVIILQTALDAERATGERLGTILGRP